jgi:hypothetical protein
LKCDVGASSVGNRAAPVRHRADGFPQSGDPSSGLLDAIAGSVPEALQTAQRNGRGGKVFVGDRGLVQHLDMALVHLVQPVAQLGALLGQPHMDRAEVVHRALLLQIAVLDHLLDAVRHVRAEIAAAQDQLADRHFRIADVEQHQTLNVVDVVDAKPVELQLHDFEKLAVETLDERNRFKVS